MPRQHTFHEIFLHINWHCHDDQAMISPEIEQPLYEAIQAYCKKTDGVFLHSCGGTETHMHIAVQIEPKMAVADLIGKIKGATSHEINSKIKKGALKWQRGYGVVSFAAANLKAIQKYIEQQKQHHANKTIREKLEVWFVDMPEGEGAFDQK